LSPFVQKQVLIPDKDQDNAEASKTSSIFERPQMRKASENEFGSQFNRFRQAKKNTLEKVEAKFPIKVKSLNSTLIEHTSGSVHKINEQ